MVDDDLAFVSSPMKEAAVDLVEFLCVIMVLHEHLRQHTHMHSCLLVVFVWWICAKVRCLGAQWRQTLIVMRVCCCTKTQGLTECVYLSL